MGEATRKMLADAGYTGEEIAAFGRALNRVRAGDDEDGAAEAEGVDVSDFYEALEAEGM